MFKWTDKIETENGNTTESVEHVIPAFDIKFPETDFKVEKTEKPRPKSWKYFNYKLDSTRKRREWIFYVFCCSQ